MLIAACGDANIGSTMAGGGSACLGGGTSSGGGSESSGGGSESSGGGSAFPGGGSASSGGGSASSGGGTASSGGGSASSGGGASSASGGGMATGIGLYPNRPASFAQSTEIDFSQTPVQSPPSDDQRDNPIPGAPDWNMIYFSNNWSETTDASAPQSAPGVWTGHWAPGAYGGGVLGQGGGHGIGNVFTYAANGATRLYVSLRVYFDFDASLWHPISNKFVNIECDHSLILMQLDEGGNWRHAEELGAAGYGDLAVDNSGLPGSIPGRVDNRPVPTRQWTQIELLIDIPNHVYKIWQDGVLTTDAAPTFASTKITTFGINAFRGGGGETLQTDLYYKYDHFLIAW
jgi:hypothetical protein